MAGVPGILKLQEEGGTVEIRATTADAGVVTVLTAYGSMDAKGKIKENGNDLLPVGSIIMWNGTTVPAGWALCDGGSYALMDGSGNVTAPNLMDRFIYGADATGGTGAAVGTYTSGSGSNGGGVTHSLTVANLPGHQHEAGSNSATMNITSSGAHSHTTQATYLVDNDDNDDTSCAMGTSCGTDASGTQTTTATVTSTGSDHTHPNGNFSGFTGLGNGLSGSTITHGLPPFFALAFIMKL
jgi:microcystin-dependent protein